MGEKSQIGARLRIAVPIRLRGMTHEHKFFDETSKTLCIGESSAITRLQSLVDLDSEIHLTNLSNKATANFRVVWINKVGREGWHDLGLELVETEGNLWGKKLSKTKGTDEPSSVDADLQCQRCHQVQHTPVPEAEAEFVSEGFTIARPCEKCKATTAWTLTIPHAEASAAKAKTIEEQRREGRAPIKMKIKVISDKLGQKLEEICETVNVSRGGTCFRTTGHYQLGEQISVILPYKEGDIAIPVPGRVVRYSGTKESNYRSVGVKLERDKR